MTRAAKSITTAVALIGLAVAVDRLALAIWRYRVTRFAAEVQESARQSTARGHQTERLSWASDRDIWAVPLVELALGGPAPSVITVDGNGGLNLTYAPPLLAWTRHVPWAYRRPPTRGSEMYPYNDVYILQISTLESRPAGKELERPAVTLEHGFPP